MELHSVHAVHQTAEPDVYSVSVEMSDINNERYITEYASRPDDPYGLAPAIRAAIDEWISDGKPVAPYEPPPEPTPEEIRAQMPDKTPREFRDILIDEGILTDAVPDEITLAIQQIPFDNERMKALNAWQYMTVAQRTDPYIDMIGALFDLSPDDIDLLWMADNES